METVTKLHCNMSDLVWLVMLNFLLITLFCLSKENFCIWGCIGLRKCM